MTSNKAQSAQDKETFQTILLVEDEQDIGEFIATAFRQETLYHVVYATTAGEALEVAASSTPCLFLLDYRLPDLDGLELADRLHALPGLETVPTLMISANSPSRQALQQRHIAFLAKPFGLIDLLQAVEHLLARPTDERFVPSTRHRFAEV